MNTLLWIVQAIVALTFLVTGVQKLIRTEAAASRDGITEGQIRAIGVLEILGAIGVVLPWATGIAGSLTPLAAIGLALIMLGAIGMGLIKQERSHLLIPVIFLMLTLVIAWGRSVSV